MTDQGTEMSAARKSSGGNVPQFTKEGALVGQPGDEEEMWIFRARGTPREFRCGTGQCLRININPCVFLMSTVLIWVLIIWGSADTDGFKKEFDNIQTNITLYWTWLYVGALNLFMVFCFYLCISKYGDILLAPPYSPEPDFPYYSWFSMLFSAGVGIGLFFFGVSEPMWFYGTVTRENVEQISGLCDYAPIGWIKSPWEDINKCFTYDSRYDRALSGMNMAWFDWGFSASSCYVVFGLPLAFYHYRYDMPLSVRSAFYPICGNRIYGWFGDVVDAFSIIGTVMGVCTSLGLGVKQMVVGINYYNDDFDTGYDNQVLLICGITFVATLSVVTGLDVGIRRLSEVNFTLGCFLMALVFYMGEPEYYLDFFVQMVGYHIQQLPHTSTVTGALENHMGRHPYALVEKSIGGGTWNSYQSGGAWPNGGTGASFENSWTIFYWGWWISWSPFVGTFLARISKGRTIREFIVGNMIVPTIMTSLWFAFFGGTGLLMQFKADNLELDCCSDANGQESLNWAPVEGTPRNGRDEALNSTVGSCYSQWKAHLTTVKAEYALQLRDGTFVNETLYRFGEDLNVFTNTSGNVTYPDYPFNETHTRLSEILNDPLYHGAGALYGKCIGPWDPCDLSEYEGPSFTKGAPKTKRKFTNIMCRLASHYYNDTLMMFEVLNYMWISRFTVIITIMALFTYFITSSDSASQVNDMISSNGEIEPPYWQRIFWAITEGLVAIVLVTTGKQDDGSVSDAALKSIRAASIVAGFPLCIIMILLIYAMYKGLVFEQAIIDGKPIKDEKRFKIPITDSFVQLYSRCLTGIGALWLTTPKATDPSECMHACLTWFMPCLVLFQVAASTAQTMIGKVLWGVAIFVPWILLIVWFFMCPEYIEWFDTKDMKDNGDSYFDGFGCENRGYVGLFGATWIIVSMVSAGVRIKVRERYGISGNAACDCLIFMFLPSVAVYQSLKQINVKVTEEMQEDWKDEDKKGGASVDTSAADAPVGQV